MEGDNYNLSVNNVGSNALVRTGKIISITNKLLSENGYPHSIGFRGELNSSIHLNFDNYVYYSFIDRKKRYLILLQEDGKLNLFDLEKKTLLREVLSLYNCLLSFQSQTILRNKYVFRDRGKISSAFLHDDVIYVSNFTDNIISYNFITNAITVIKLFSESNENVDGEWECISFSNVNKEIMGFVSNWLLIEAANPTFKETRHLNFLNPQNFFATKKIKAVDDFYYQSIKYLNEHIYAVNSSGVDEFTGQILKQNLKDGSYSFITAFEESWVEDFLFNEDKSNLICYTNGLCQDYDSSSDNTPALVIIDTKKEQIIKKIKFHHEICSMTISKCYKYIGLLNEVGGVIIYDSTNFSVVTEFTYDNYVKFDDDITPTHISPPHIFVIHFPYVYIGNRKILEIYN